MKLLIQAVTAYTGKTNMRELMLLQQSRTVGGKRTKMTSASVHLERFANNECEQRLSYTTYI